MSLPNSPDDCPREWIQDDRQIVSTLSRLSDFQFVEIRFESEHSDCGEQVGKWRVSIEPLARRSKSIDCEHEDLFSAIWYCFTLANSVDMEDWREREALRASARAKLDAAGLTKEERRIVGL